MIESDEQFISAWLRWGRESAKDQLEGLLAGSTVELVIVPDIPTMRAGTSRMICKAWIGLKSAETASDATENAAWTNAGGLQSISTTEVAGRGVIESDSEGSPELRFDLTAANTLVITHIFSSVVKVGNESRNKERNY